MSPTAPTPAPTPASSHGDFMAWLEELRTARDLSWAEIARRSGISENGLRKIRQGETTPRPATVDALAAAFTDDAVELTPVGVRRPEASTWVTVEVTGPRQLDRDTAGRLIVFLQHSARAWLATVDCPEGN